MEKNQKQALYKLLGEIFNTEGDIQVLASSGLISLKALHDSYESTLCKVRIALTSRYRSGINPYLSKSYRKGFDLLRG